MRQTAVLIASYEIKPNVTAGIQDSGWRSQRPIIARMLFPDDFYSMSLCL